jgi:hypothetical protein
MFTFVPPKETSFLSSDRKTEITWAVTEKYQKTVEEQFRTMLQKTAGSKRFKGAA